MRAVYISFFALICFTSVLKGQYCGKVTYGIEEGMMTPNAHPFCDSQGRLWAGSNAGGLNVFDGHAWKTFTPRDGLIEDKTNPTFEDKEGGIWISQHTSGVCRYMDGHFQQYLKVPLSTENLEKGKKRYPYSSYVQQLFYDKKKEIPVTFIQDTSKQFWIYEYDYATQSFDLEGYPFFDEATLSKYAPFMAYENLQKSWLYADGEGDYYVALTLEQETQLIYQDGRVIHLPATGISANFWRIPNGKGGHHLYKQDHKQLFLFEESKWNVYPAPDLQRYGEDYEKTPLSFYHVFKLYNEYSANEMYTLWKVEDPSLKDHFVLAEHDPFTTEIIQTLLVQENERIWFDTYMVKDKAGTFWYKSNGKIVRLFPDQMIVPVDVRGMPTETWSVTGTPTGKVWFSSFSGTSTEVGLRAFDGLHLKKPMGEISSFYSFSEGSLTDQKGHIYFIANFNPDTLRQGILKFEETGSYELLCKGQRGFFLDWDEKGQLLFVTQKNGLWLLPKGKKGIEQADWFKIDAAKGLKIVGLRTALEDHQGNYWMGGHNEGLAVYIAAQDTVYNWIKSPNKGYGILCMAEDDRGNLWLGTNKGLHFIKNNKAINSQIDLQGSLQEVAKDYIGESRIEICKLYDEHTLIVGNREGYFLLDLDAWYAKPSSLLFHPVTKANGYQGKHIYTNGIWIDHNKDIWTVGQGGAVRYSPYLLPKDTIVPLVSIDSFEVGKKTFKHFNEKIKLGSTESTVRIYFSHSNSPFLFDNTRFRYRLSGDKGWSDLLNQGYIDYPNLGAGDYTFELLAEKNGFRGGAKFIKFRISPVLWRNPWAWSAISGLVFFVGLFLLKKEKEIFKQRLWIEQNKSAMANTSKEKEKLQMQNILNQLNPHFINNALQWLQIRMDNNDDEEGVRVIGKLSNNIRSVFQLSRAKKAFHQIEEELKLTDNYLYVQQRRFGNKLHYTLPGIKDIGSISHFKIPPLMIQIHVENAIEHGIRNKKEGGTVNIQCRKEKSYLIISIEDDGIGRKVAKKIGSKGTGNGTKMLKEMERFYNEQNEQKISQKYEDDIFTTENGQHHGTRLTIKIPENYNYE